MVSLIIRLALVFYINLAGAVSSQQPLGLDQQRYKLGDAIPVSCLNRTAEGEHIEKNGQLQYIPFPTCNETGRPLELYFGVEKDINCTIDFVTDPFFHLLEYYVHNDSPFTCRIPSRPVSPSAALDKDKEQEAWIPLIIALTGTLQLSHLHVSTHLNVLLHAAPRQTDPGVVAAGTAYSIATREQKATRIIIGDPLPLSFSVRWYPTTTLPSGWTGVGGHIYASTLVYCMLSAGAATAVCFAWFRGVELPRRLKGHGRERMGGMEGGGRLGGYGYGLSNGGGGLGGYGVGGGKRD
ncbi:hypothetical protein K461DRAFT_227764 [Myriangium duriaei CBS 260.36]|uniref:Uncharacterized protein n=1 Tax=Myriangium duriaei CBS 260.36 TaxID=1168546 RepID=A0A9P4MEC2_9PEZI|nr:hypothetical protein K461DRAFT_227764 [Myriangium duriaei CBS 260.36]